MRLRQELSAAVAPHGDLPALALLESSAARVSALALRGGQ